MRIIGGKLKGRVINLPLHFEARPTTDFAKEGLFNVLQNEMDFTGMSMLDLFSGSGSISAEFISRGAEECVCVEMNRTNAAQLKKTFLTLGIKNAKTVHCNVFYFLEICSRSFDVIFADPPYKLQGLDTIPDRVLSKTFSENGTDCPILKKGGYFILEHPAEYNFSGHTNFVKEKKYGNVHFSFFTIL